METLSSTTTIWNLIISSTTTVWVCQSSSVSVWDLGWTNSSTVLWCWRHLWVWQCFDLTIQLSLGLGFRVGKQLNSPMVLATPLGPAIQPSLGMGWVCQSSSVSVWDLGWTSSSTVLWCWRHLWVWQCLELTIQLRLGGAGDTIGSGNSAQFGSGNSIRTVLATPLDLAIQLSLGGAGDTIGYGNTDKFGSGNSIQFQFGSENTYLYQ